MRLTVQPIKPKNIWRDCVNIPEAHRKDARGERLKEGTICKIAADGRSTRVYLKGVLGETRPIVKMDEKTRNDLGVVIGTEYEFELTKAGCWRQLLWAWDATDPVPRIAARPKSGFKLMTHYSQFQVDAYAPEARCPLFRSLWRAVP